jgi:L-fuculose-phosphate aldolase
LDILRARPDVNAVVHTHPTYCTILAIMGLEIPPIHYMVACAGGDTIRCAPYATFGTQELSAHAVKALDGRLACLLEHHGMIAVGPSLAKAMWLAVEVETLARQYHGCLQIGKPRLLPTEEIENVRIRMAGYGHAEK